MQVNVKVDTTGLDKIVRDMPQAVGAGLKKTAERARTKASDMIRAKYNLSKSGLEKAAPGKEKGSWLQILEDTKAKRFTHVILRISGNRIPLYRFGAKWTRTWYKRPGATASVEGGRTATYRHSFIEEMKSGHTGVFIRKSLVKGGVGVLTKGTTGRGRKATLPPGKQIVEQAGPAPGQMIKKGDMLDRLKAFIAETVPGLILREFDWRSKKGK